jgi:hypothetical protein
MNNSKLFRTAGWCALASVLCMPLALVSFMLSGTTPMLGNIGMLFEIIMLLLLVYVFYALSVAHRSESKWLGSAGVIILVAAMVVDVVSQQYQTSFLFGLWYLLFSLPFLIFGYLGFRSALMPRWLAALALVTGGLTFIAAVAGFLGNPDMADSIQTLSIPFMLAWEVWLWRVLVSKKFTSASLVAAAV